MTQMKGKFCSNILHSILYKFVIQANISVILFSLSKSSEEEQKPDRRYDIFQEILARIEAE